MQYEWPLLWRASWGPVPDQEAGIAGELIRGLRDDLNNELLGDGVSAPGVSPSWSGPASSSSVRRSATDVGAYAGWTHLGPEIP